MKKNATNIHINPKAIVDAIYNDLSLEVREALPKKQSLYKMVYNIQKKLKPTLPSQPKSLNELDIPDEFKMLSHDGLFYDSGKSFKNRIILFTTKKNLDTLANCKVWCADGTFKVPKLFRQLFIIHGKIGNKFIPLVYVLMEKKNKKSYNKVFLYLQSLKVGFNFILYFPKHIHNFLHTYTVLQTFVHTTIHTFIYIFTHNFTYNYTHFYIQLNTLLHTIIHTFT